MFARPDLAQLRALHLAKFLRYSGVSAVNVLLGLVTFNLCRALFDLSWVMANVVSVLIGAVPAYFMSRAWVWKVDGKISMSTEVLPFWGINFVGFVASSLTVAAVDVWTENPLVVNFFRMFAWGVVWLFKYFVLDKYLFAPAPPREDAVVATG
jgi:putative flippase GtrA